MDRLIRFFVFSSPLPASSSSSYSLDAQYSFFISLFIISRINLFVFLLFLFAGGLLHLNQPSLHYFDFSLSTCECEENARVCVYTSYALSQYMRRMLSRLYWTSTFRYFFLFHFVIYIGILSIFFIRVQTHTFLSLFFTFIRFGYSLWIRQQAYLWNAVHCLFAIIFLHQSLYAVPLPLSTDIAPHTYVYEQSSNSLQPTASAGPLVHISST